MSTPLIGSSDILSTIERILPDLGPSLQRVASFILAHSNTLRTCSLEELAQASGTSKASVVRFCQALGFSGFRDLQRTLQEQHRWTDMVSEAPAPPWPGDDSAASHPPSTLDYLSASVQGTGRLLHGPSLELVARRIANARRVIWYGLGDSGFLGLSADHRCMINGLNTRAITSSRDVMNLAKQLMQDDVVVCISRSGRLPNLVEAIRHLKSTTDAHLVAITGDPGAPLVQTVNVALISASIDLYVDEQRTTLQTAQMAVLDALIARVLQLRFPKVHFSGVPKKVTNNGEAKR